MEEACGRFNQADLDYTMAAAEGYIDQAELDKLSKLSTESWMIVSDSDFDILNGSEDPLMDEIASKIAEEKSAEALQLYKDWKSAYRREALDDPGYVEEVEDYSSDFEGDVNIPFATTNTAIDAEAYTENDAESSSIITVVRDDDDHPSELVVPDIPAEKEFPFSQLRSVINGDFYEYLDGHVVDKHTPDEWKCECIECIMDEMGNTSVMDTRSHNPWSATDTDLEVPKLSPSNVGMTLSGVQVTYADSDTSIGAVTAGLPVILITSFNDSSQKPSMNPVPVDIQRHFFRCFCWDCFLYKTKALKSTSKLRLHLPEDDINTGTVAVGLPPIVISDHDQDPNPKWVSTYLNGAKPEPIANVVAKILNDASCVDDQRCHARIEEVEDDVSGSDTTDIADSTADEEDCTTGSTASTSDVKAELSKDAGPLYEQVSTTFLSTDPAFCQSKSDGSTVVSKLVAAGIAASVLTIFVPKWALAGAVVGFALVGR